MSNGLTRRAKLSPNYAVSPMPWRRRKTLEIQIGGERIYVPPYAAIEFEYERGEGYQEIEIELKWKHDGASQR